MYMKCFPCAIMKLCSFRRKLRSDIANSTMKACVLPRDLFRLALPLKMGFLKSRLSAARIRLLYMVRECVDVTRGNSSCVSPISILSPLQGTYSNCRNKTSVKKHHSTHCTLRGPVQRGGGGVAQHYTTSSDR